MTAVWWDAIPELIAGMTNRADRETPCVTEYNDLITRRNQ